MTDDTRIDTPETHEVSPELGDDPATAMADGARADVESQAAPKTTREALIDQLGGWQGMLDSSLPVIAFVVANTIAGLTPAIWVAVGTGVLVAIVRLFRKESVQQAVSGLFGVAIAAFIAHRTGQAKGYFLLGIWASFVYAGGFALSVLVRWPAVGIIWEYIEGNTTSWRKSKPLMRVYTWTTAMWAFVCLARALVQRFLYDSDHTGWLAVARLAMGYPVTLAALGITLLAVRRVRKRLTPEETPAKAS